MLDALGDLRVVAARLAHAGQVALDVGGEDGHADAAECLGQHLERDGLAGAGRAGDQAVTVRHLREQMEVALALGDIRMGSAI